MPLSHASILSAVFVFYSFALLCPGFLSSSWPPKHILYPPPEMPNRWRPRDQRKGGGRERGGSHQPQSPGCALPDRGRPRLPSPLPSGERRGPCTTRDPPPRQTPPPDRPRPHADPAPSPVWLCLLVPPPAPRQAPPLARYGPAPSASPALRLCGLKGRIRPGAPRPAQGFTAVAAQAWRARVRRPCFRASCSARCPSSTSTRTRTR